VTSRPNKPQNSSTISADDDPKIKKGRQLKQQKKKKKGDCDSDCVSFVTVPFLMRVKAMRVENNEPELLRKEENES
jgi:hypothetical protein